jgi:hypothetical protein
VERLAGMLDETCTTRLADALISLPVPGFCVLGLRR